MKFKNLRLLFLLFILQSCASTSIVSVWSDVNFVFDPKQPHKFVYFVQSNNQINSRIAQDELTRISAYPSIQGYLYTKGDRINAGNREFYRTKMKQDDYDFAVLMRLVDSVQVQQSIPSESTTNVRSFYSDYSFYIDPYAYNPGYERPNTIFTIETSIYAIETGNLVWQSLSKVYNPQSVTQAIQETSTALIEKMKRNGFVKE